MQTSLYWSRSVQERAHGDGHVPSAGARRLGAVRADGGDAAVRERQRPLRGLVERRQTRQEASR